MITFKKYPVAIQGKLLFEVTNFALERGKINYLIGKNGSGKSTFLKSIIRHTDSKDGMLIEGKEKITYTPKEYARKIAYVPSKITLNDYTTVEDFLLMGRYPYGSPFSGFNTTDKAVLEEVLTLLDIHSLRTKFIHQLSDGQQQLISIGRALVQEVDYLLLDEPTAFLDYYNKIRMLDLVEQLSQKKEMGILVVTHDVEYLLKLKKALYFVNTNTNRLEYLETDALENSDKLLEEIYK